jgi:anti-sigma factor RsiW
MLQHYGGIDEAPGSDWLAGLRLVLGSPGLRGGYLKTNAEMQRALAEAIAERAGLDIERDMLPEILAGAVTAAVQVTVRRWATAAPPVPLRLLLSSALRQLMSASAR